MENKEAENKKDKQLLDDEERIQEISDTMKQKNIRIFGVRGRGKTERHRWFI